MLAVGWGSLPAVFAQYGGALPGGERINGKLVWKAFEPQRQVLQRSSAVIYTDEKSRIKALYGTVVSARGHVLTKASEVVGKKHLSLRVGGKLYTDVKITGVDEVWDVAMLKVKSGDVFVPVMLSDGDDVEQGHWVVSNGSTSRSRRRVRVGIVSAATREIRSPVSRVILGVVLSGGKDKGLKVGEVGGGAKKAGVKKGDVLLSVGGVKVGTREELVEALKGKQAGDSIPVEVLRGKKKVRLEVKLAARPKGKRRMTRNDMMSGGENSLSGRRSGFPRVIHHDTPLTRVSVGGPLLSLDGVCVGMNIARASRVATFAIPAKELGEIIGRMRGQE